MRMQASTSKARVNNSKGAQNKVKWAWTEVEQAGTKVKHTQIKVKQVWTESEQGWAQTSVIEGVQDLRAVHAAQREEEEGRESGMRERRDDQRSGWVKMTATLW